jgi:hypothetical protein
MLVALGWVALGLAIAVGGWRMDRLEKLSIEPWSAPGLVPGMLGVLMVLFGAMLAWRSRPSAGGPAAPGGAPADVRAEHRTEGRADAGTPAGGPPGPGEMRRVLPILALAFAWVFGALGRGLPFAATSATLVIAWIALLRWRDWRASGSVARGLGIAVAIGTVACATIAVLFADVFLVRLP